MKSKSYGLVLTAREGISHHDPTTGNDSNTLTFNRQRQFVYRKPTDTPVFRHIVNNICEQNKMPENIAELTSRLSAPEWLSVAYVRLLLDIHNRGDGDGLLSGMERYRMLENRLQTTAVRCHTLHRMWSILTDDLQLGTHAAKYDEQISAFWTLPPSVQYQMLTTMAEQYRAITTLARVWHTKNKEQFRLHRAIEKVSREIHGDAANLPTGDNEIARLKELILQCMDWLVENGASIFNADELKSITMALSITPEKWYTTTFSEEHFPEPPDHIVLDVPAISVNSIRHQLVREPAWLHLCNALGIEPAARGVGELPVHAESIFYNGGNIKAGATQPSNAFFLGGKIREAYPNLDLLGGVTASFDIGESKLKISAWIVCAENRDALPEELRETAQAKTSVFDMLDNVTRTRQATASGEGQMIYNYETLVKGAQVYVELTLTPYTQAMTEGALSAALDYYAKNVNVIGGQSARGHSHVGVEWLTDKPMGIDEYEAYLKEWCEELKEGIVDGTLCTGKKVVK